MRHLLCYVFGIVVTLNAFSQDGNYLTGNGMVLEKVRINNVIWTIRNHNQELVIGDLASKGNLVLYKDLGSKTELVENLRVGDTISIRKLAESVVNDKYIVWLNITSSTAKVGWIELGSFDVKTSSFRIPYFENRWEILSDQSLENNLKIRKLLEQHVSVDVNLNIREKPSLTNSKVLAQIKNNSQIVIVNIYAATEEEYVIDGKKDRWLLTKYNGVTGYIFGGYVSVERGGPKYYTPNGIIEFSLGNY